MAQKILKDNRGKANAETLSPSPSGLISKNMSISDVNSVVDLEPLEKLHRIAVDMSIITLYVEAHLRLAHRLLSGKERVDRVITHEQLDTRAEYMAALPRLCDDIRQLTALAKQQYRVLLKRYRPKDQFRNLMDTQDAILRLLDRYHLQEQVVAAMLPNISVFRRQLAWCFQIGKTSGVLESFKSGPAKYDTANKLVAGALDNRTS